MSVTIQVTLNRFPGLAGAFDAMVEGALDAGVTAAIATADQHTRVDTGALRANKTISRGAGYREITWNQDYAAYQNFGTYKMSGTGFAEQGIDAAAPVIAAALGRFG